MRTNFFKKLAVLVLVLALAVPTVLTTQSPVATEAAAKTVKKNGYTYNKIPYTSNKLKITKLTCEKTKCTAIVKNGTGKAISGLSYFPYTCYNKQGEVVESGNMYLEMCNKDESCICYVSYPSSTVKIIFGEAYVKAGTTYKKSSKTQKVDGIKITKLPVTYSKVKFTKASVKTTSYSTTLTLTYKNNTGKAMSGLSSVLLKCYNKDGQVLAGGYKYLKEINNGETTKAEITLNTSVAEIYILGIDVREGEASGTAKTHKVDGIETNVTPYKKDGLTIDSISFDGNTATLKVTNKTGKTIDDISGFAYKSYNTDGEVINSGTFYLRQLNDGETCVKSSVVGKTGETLAKVVFDTTQIYELKDKIPTPSKLETVEGIKMNKMPYSVDGLKIDFKEQSSFYYYFIMTNKTGHAVKNPGINYRVFDKDGCVIEDSTIYGKPMDDGEKCLCQLIPKDTWTRVEFYGSTQFEGVEFGDIKTAKADGITTNKVPYTNCKLKITGISFTEGYSSYNATVVVQNNTGADIKSSDYLWYRCYDADGVVIDSGYKYATAIGKGESASIDVTYLPKEATKIIFQLYLK